jgi:hypothetical protein
VGGRCEVLRLPAARPSEGTGRADRGAGAPGGPSSRAGRRSTPAAPCSRPRSRRPSGPPPGVGPPPGRSWRRGEARRAGHEGVGDDCARIAGLHAGQAGMRCALCFLRRLQGLAREEGRAHRASAMSSGEGCSCTMHDDAKTMNYLHPPASSVPRGSSGLPVPARTAHRLY